MSYNLTSRQRSELKWVVDNVRAGLLDEHFVIHWSFGGRIMTGWQPEAPRELWDKQFDSGTLEAWKQSSLVIVVSRDEAQLGYPQIEYTFCTITQMAYDAVDNDFREPEVELNEGRLHSFLGSPKHFSMKELQTVAFNMGIDPEEIEGRTTSEYALHLITYARRRNRVWELVKRALALP